MTFLAPAALWLLAALPLIVVLWLLQARFRTQRVPSLLLWDGVPAHAMASRTWRLPPFDVLIVLQLAAAATLAIAVARPALDVPGGRQQALVLAASPAQFDAARGQLIALLNAAAPGERFDVWLASSRPRPLATDADAGRARAALDVAHAEPGVPDLTTTIRAAAMPGVDEVVVATDGTVAFDVPPALSAPVRFRRVGGTSNGVALSEASIRRPVDGSSRWQGFASLVNSSSTQQTAPLQVFADGVLVQSQVVDLDALARVDVAFGVPATTRDLRVVLTGQASEAQMQLDDAAARHVLVVSSEPSIWLRALAPAPVRAVTPSEYTEPQSGEIALFDGFTPHNLPDTERILVNAPSAAPVYRTAAPGTDPDDPLLRGIDLTGLDVAIGAPAPVPEWSSLTVGSAHDFLVGHGLLTGRRTVELAFNPADSNLTRMAAFPLLLANAVAWLSGDEEIHRVDAAPPRALEDVPGIPGLGRRAPNWFELWQGLAALAVLLLSGELIVAARRGLFRRVPLALGAGALVIATLALLQPSVPLPGAHRNLVVAVDRTSAAIAQAVLDQIESAKPTGDRMSVVDFGGDTPNLGAGLATAAALARGQPGSRIVVISDGHAPFGDLEKALRSMDGTAIDVVPRGAAAHAPVVLERLDVPPYVRAGDSFDASLTVGATDATYITVSATVDGAVVADRQVALVAGENRLTLALAIAETGFHRVGMAAGDEFIASFVSVKPPERVLVIEERPGEGRAVINALRQAGRAVDLRAPNAMGNLAQLETYDALVLANVSATSLSLDQQRTLRTFVAEHGRGLVVLGGTTSYVLGSYEGSVLEQLLPVVSEVPPRKEDARMALLLVIDISQSMDRVVDGVSGIEMAKQAAVLASRALSDDDQVGVLIFNHRFRWLQPIARVGDIGRGPLETAIASLAPSGGTEIFAALDEGASQMRRVQADLRHIVLFTDGNSRDANYDAVTGLLRQDRIGLSTVGLGPEADTRLLARLARDGQGRFYFSDRPSELPRILGREVAIAKRSAVVEGTIEPRLITPSPILRSIAPGTLPSLGGYVATRSRDAADVVLSTEDDKPLLAHWRSGLGRVVAWTSDVGGPWSRAWSDWAGAARVWQQAVGWAAGVPTQPDFSVRVTASGPAAQVVLDEMRDDQWADLASPVATVNGVAVALRQTAPGRYETSLVTDSPGVYEVRVADGARSETSGFVVSADPEAASFGTDERTLRRITSDTGGRMLRNPAEAFDYPSPGMHWQALWPWLLTLAAGTFVCGLVLRRLDPVRFSDLGALVAGRVRR